MKNGCRIKVWQGRQKFNTVEERGGENHLLNGQIKGRLPKHNSNKIKISDEQKNGHGLSHNKRSQDRTSQRRIPNISTWNFFTYLTSNRNREYQITQIIVFVINSSKSQRRWTTHLVVNIIQIDLSCLYITRGYYGQDKYVKRLILFRVEISRVTVLPN